MLISAALVASHGATERAASHGATERAIPSPADSAFGAWTRDCMGPFELPGDDLPVFLVFSPAADGKARSTPEGAVQLGHNSRLYLSRACLLDPDVLRRTSPLEQ